MMDRMRCCILLYLLIIILLEGCTICHENQVKSVSDGAWVADLRYRECGSYSGYAVAVYSREDADLCCNNGEKEQFQSIYTTHHNENNSIPIHIKWSNDNNLVIYHKTRMSLEDAESQLMIIKAEKSYRSVNIEYIPEPVIWRRE